MNEEPATTHDAELPAWLAVRRERESKSPPPIQKNAPTPVTVAIPTASPALPKREPNVAVTKARIVVTDASPPPAAAALFGQGTSEPWMSPRAMTGILISLGVHAVVMLAMAFIMVSHAVSEQGMAIWGVVGDSDEVGSDIVIDTSLPVDAGEAAPAAEMEVAQAAELSDSGGGIADSLRLGFGGKGHGEGIAGEGTSIGVPSLKVPGHAQTKGSFTAWADPRDPKPHEGYHIVIQIRLPSRVKTYNGSDLSGRVVGTDGYRQEIDLKSHKLPVENGAVEARVFVPGGAQRVRDTIKVHSKLLNEKQTFEIEF